MAWLNCLWTKRILKPSEFSFLLVDVFFNFFCRFSLGIDALETLLG